MSDVVIRGGSVLVDGGFVSADVRCRDGVIAEIGHIADGAREVVDATRLLVAPGFVEAQINGGWGHDFTTEPGSITAVASALPASGVTAFLPTIVTAAPTRRAAAQAALAAHTRLPGAAIPVGLHFEGPLISPARIGAHDAAWVGRTDPDELARWTAAAGVRLVTLAPEAPGALDAIRQLRAQGVIVAIGHTDCNAADFAAARA